MQRNESLVSVCRTLAACHDESLEISPLADIGFARCSEQTNQAVAACLGIAFQSHIAYEWLPQYFWNVIEGN